MDQILANSIVHQRIGEILIIITVIIATTTITTTTIIILEVLHLPLIPTEEEEDRLLQDEIEDNLINNYKNCEREHTEATELILPELNFIGE